MTQGNTAPRALGIDGTDEPAPITVRVALDAEASAFVRCLMREHGTLAPQREVEAIVVAGLHALGL